MIYNTNSAEETESIGRELAKKLDETRAADSAAVLEKDKHILEKL